MSKKIVAAMSGGVDSAVAAYLLKSEGFDVVGITLRLAPDVKDDHIERTGRCCSIDDMIDARRVCEKIGIPFYAIDAQAKFKETVFDPFVKDYQNGITPIPCLACNHTVKFGDLLQSAQELGAGLATGHYAKIVGYRGHLTLARPDDLDRDQTYYLYGTDPKSLDKIQFPLGNLKKPQVREIAQKIGLLVHDKKDSHEICFVPDGDHAKVVEKALGKTFSGSIVDDKGNNLGEHRGVHKYTIGQRRGLGVSSKERLFVADIDSKDQKVVLAKKNALATSKIQVRDFRALVPHELWPEKIQIKIRARSAAEPAKLLINDGKFFDFQFDASVYGVALGQAAVVYDGDVMLGGGILSGRLDGAFPRTIDA
ncbi:MAG: tRNA 2-thiouridine(34) synthase MnmA [Myxococcales bacterium]|nr:tRNA 2-thiouridine(34) synthase MnmA [Myxococcales bacterium]USN50557.1 MAG: tRNA 2-thiouridine(34) synthase MnmA [Myxococcales bacterium]